MPTFAWLITVAVQPAHVVRLLAILVAGLLAAPSSLAFGQGKFPEPAGEAQAKAEAEIKGLYKQEFAAATQPAKKVELARTLHQQAGELKGDATARFVLLREAASLAAAGGELASALQTIDEIAKTYTIEPAKLKAELIVAASKGIVTPAQRKAVADAAVAVQDEAATADDYDSAKRLGELALRLARDPAQKKPIAQHSLEIERRGKAYAEVKDDIDRVRRGVEDPAAFLRVGKYHLLTKSDWPTALPLLARCGDSGWKQAAAGELAGPKSPEEQLKVANAWWSLADSQDDDARRLLQAKACQWYRKLLDTTTGLTKSLVEKRLVDFDGLILLQNKTYTWEASTTNFAKYDHLQFDVGIGLRPDGFGFGYAGVEVDKCPRLLVTMDAFPTYTYMNGVSYAGMIVDYHTSAGYTKCVGLRVQGGDRVQDGPVMIWGCKSKPHEYVDLGKRAAYDLDLRTWAPKDWDGKYWFTAVVSNIGNNAQMTLHVAPKK